MIVAAGTSLIGTTSDCGPDARACGCKVGQMVACGRCVWPVLFGGECSTNACDDNGTCAIGLDCYRPPLCQGDACVKTYCQQQIGGLGSACDPNAPAESGGDLCANELYCRRGSSPPPGQSACPDNPSPHALCANPVTIGYPCDSNHDSPGCLPCEPGASCIASVHRCRWACPGGKDSECPCGRELRCLDNWCMRCHGACTGCDSEHPCCPESGASCVWGVCQPKCKTSADCCGGSGVCIAGQCERCRAKCEACEGKNCCAGLMCDGDVCQPATCTANADCCGADWMCFEGRCHVCFQQDWPCGPGVAPCCAGLECQKHACTKPSCLSEGAQCGADLPPCCAAAGLSCTGGVCSKAEPSYRLLGFVITPCANPKGVCVEPDPAYAILLPVKDFGTPKAIAASANYVFVVTEGTPNRLLAADPSVPKVKFAAKIDETPRTLDLTNLTGSLEEFADVVVGGVVQVSKYTVATGTGKLSNATHQLLPGATVAGLAPHPLPTPAANVVSLVTNGLSTDLLYRVDMNAPTIWPFKPSFAGYGTPVDVDVGADAEYAVTDGTAPWLLRSQLGGKDFTKWVKLPGPPVAIHGAGLLRGANDYVIVATRRAGTVAPTASFFNTPSLTDGLWAELAGDPVALSVTWIRATTWVATKSPDRIEVLDTHKLASGSFQTLDLGKYGTPVAMVVHATPACTQEAGPCGEPPDDDTGFQSGFVHVVVK